MKVRYAIVQQDSEGTRTVATAYTEDVAEMKLADARRRNNGPATFRIFDKVLRRFAA
jgi:hypothetical protein